MTSLEARKLLLRWRPGQSEEHDPEIAAALELAARDPELKSWLEQHSAFQRSMRQSLRAIPVPPDLRDRVLAQSKILRPPTSWWLPPGWVAAAAIVLLLTFVGLRLRSIPDDSFQTFRSRMVRTVLRQYTMDIVTNDMSEVRRFLSTRKAPSDYILTPGLSRLAVTGAGVLRWQGQLVSMVCLNSTNQGPLFLFVVDRTALSRPPAGPPEFLQVSELMTASWTQGEKTYLLAGPGGRDALGREL
jgi:hypothetical protein